MYGTCAGMIMLADRITDAIAGQETFGGLDVVVARNAFGSQVDSFETDARCRGFRRRPGARDVHPGALVTAVGDRATAIATLPDGGVVAVEQGPLIATAFHPEVSGEIRFHQRFLELVRAAA